MFNVVDVVCLILLTTGTLIGLYRKLSGELARFIGAVIVFALTVSFYRQAALWLAAHTRLSERPDIAMALSYLLLAIGAFILMLLIRLILRRIMQVTFNKKINIIGGAVVGFLKSALIVTILVTALGMWPNPWLKNIITEESFTGRFVFERIHPTLSNRLDVSAE